MAIYTKFGEKLLNESLRVDQNCIFAGDTVKVWATVQGQTAERQYWFTDLRADNKRELREVIQANLKKRAAC